MEKLESLVTRDEIRRLEKAVKDKDRHKLIDWMSQFEIQISNQLQKKFEEEYQDQLAMSVDNFMIAIVFTLHFSELTKFGNKRIEEFIKDIYATIDLFSKKEETPISYMETLKEAGIVFFNNLLEERKKASN